VLVSRANIDITSRCDSDRRIIEDANELLERARRNEYSRVYIHDDLSAGDR